MRVHQAHVDSQNSSIQVTLTTPGNFNNIEKEIYDSGYTLIY
jgi:hypothetical protein